MTHAPLQKRVASAPRFSRDERDRRYADVREAMRGRGIDCLLIPHHTGEWDNYRQTAVPDMHWRRRRGSRSDVSIGR